MLDIKITKTQNPKIKPDQTSLGFGKYFTDHMFILDYEEGKGWHNARIVPYGPLSFDPACMVFHYGQAVFEGLKAYLTSDGRTLLFRPVKNIERINTSNERLCIPKLNEADALQAIKALIDVDRDWIPTEKDTSLYIRPFIIGTDPFIGVHPSVTYKFMVILSPVGAYYPEGLNPIKIFVENNYVRAVKGGLGFTKASANYAASLKAQMEAKEKGYTQVLWLDGIQKKYVEEVGTMNVFFKINNEVITPALEGSILPGVTRDSVIEMLKSFNIPVTERAITIEEVYAAHKAGSLEEVFGTGTAAVISPVGELNWNDNRIIIGNAQTGELSKRLYDEITAIQNGEAPDNFGWTEEVK